MSLENEHENKTTAEETKAPENESWLKKNARKAGNTALIVGALGATAATMEGCQKHDEVILPAEVIKKKFETKFAAGSAAVFYNTTLATALPGQPAITQANLIDTLKKYDYVAVQPALISAQEATANNIKAFGYGSGISLVPPGTTSGAAYNALYAAIQAQDGFLKNASGGLLEDPTIGNTPRPYMVDLRKPEVYRLMKDFLINIGKTYPKGLFFDSMDAATFVENNDPTRYAGITQKMVDLLKEVANEVTQKDAQGHVVSGRGVVAGGGLFPSTVLPDNVILDALATSNCVVWQESQYALGGVVRPQSDHDWTKARFVELAKAVKRASEADPWKPHVLGVFSFEDFRENGPNLPPRTFEDRKQYAQNIANFYRDISNAVRAATSGGTTDPVPMQVSIYTADFGFDKVHDVRENFRLKGLISKLEKPKTTIEADEFLQIANKHQANEAALTAMLDDIKNKKPETRPLKEQLKHMGMLDEQGRDIDKSPYLT